jgi:hypothetical protein
MEGGYRSRVINEQLRSDYKKKLIIDIFRANIQGYYKEILMVFKGLVD